MSTLNPNRLRKMRLGPLLRLAVVAASLALLVVGASSAAAQSAPAPQTVSIDNFAFTPAEISVSTGTTVSWANKQNARHTTTADNGEWDSGILANDQSFELPFDRAGDFAYHCDIHPDMVGVVHVTAGAAAAPLVIDERAAIEEEPVAVVNAEPAAEFDPPPAPIVLAATPVPTVAPAPTAAPRPALIAAPTPAPTPQRSYRYGN
jgi:plastocyanin